MTAFTHFCDPTLKRTIAIARPASAAAKVLASQIARHLDGAGVRTVFGVPGGGNNLEVVEACESQGLRFVLTHGETAAAIMASVDGELSGAPGACLATRGPGATSGVNGVAHAMLDRAPVAAITDAVSASDRSRISHQRLDHVGLFRRVTKWSGAVGTANADAILPNVLALATAPAPGPVHLDFIPDSTRSTAPIVPNTPRPRTSRTQETSCHRADGRSSL
jgi:acetolactate synthase I/II/III large subunit